MIEVQDNPEAPGSSIIEARSNLSMTLDRLAGVFLLLSAVTLAVAVYPLILGLWPVMVVAVLHLLIVGWCLRLAWRGNWARERLLVGPEDLVVEHFDLRSQSKRSWPAAWVRVKVDRQAFGDATVVVSCQGESQRIGVFLPVNERLELARVLQQSLRAHTAWKASG
ncbi:MAG: DUF2244 domain-containing protein [Wenzhouxiangella sp.]|nr:DUF2244 domain-containing protein [Wenzhouxiangella sp.]TVR95689.1 MAG: DUF2244 domain-containing protein [Wenzhouxiangellaceae bacterium]